MISGCIRSGFPMTRRASALSCSGRFANTVCPSRVESRRWLLQGEKSYGAYILARRLMTHPDLAGKAAIVTGAGAGIGLAIARATRRRGLPCALRGHRRRCSRRRRAEDRPRRDRPPGRRRRRRAGDRHGRGLRRRVRRRRQARRQRRRSFISPRSPTRPSTTSIASSGSTCAARGCAPNMRHPR